MKNQTSILDLRDDINAAAEAIEDLQVKLDRLMYSPNVENQEEVAELRSLAFVMADRLRLAAGR